MRVIPRRLAASLAVLAFAGLAPVAASAAVAFPAVTLEGGLSSTGITPDPWIETRRILGGAAGVSFDVHITERFSIEPGLLFVRRGTRLPDATIVDGGGQPGGTVTSYLTADYTDVPVMARFEPPTESTFKPFALVGPRFGFKTAERLETRGAVTGSTGTSKFESFEFGASAGGGVEYGAGPHRVTLDVRYDAGITQHDDGSGTTFRTDVFLVMLGYTYHPAH